MAKEYTDKEKIEGFDYFIDKRRRLKPIIGDYTDKYMDAAIAGEKLDPHEVMKDMNEIYNMLFLKY